MSDGCFTVVIRGVFPLSSPQSGTSRASPGHGRTSGPILWGKCQTWCEFPRAAVTKHRTRSVAPQFLRPGG